VTRVTRLRRPVSARAQRSSERNGNMPQFVVGTETARASRCTTKITVAANPSCWFMVIR
jgi:hypothetical protein